jgi:hypothetical protein
MRGVIGVRPQARGTFQEDDSPGTEIARPFSCGLVAAAAHFPLHHLILIAPGLELSSLTSANGLGRDQNHFRLPARKTVDVALVDVHWYKLAHRRGVLADAWRGLERSADLIVGVDGYDTVRLGAPPDMLDRCAIVLKSPGLSVDRALYNHEVGPYFPDSDWWSTRSPSSRRYTPHQLAKLRSVPYFISVLPAIRRRIRARLGVCPTTRAMRAAGDLLGNALCTGLRRSTKMRLSGVYFVGSLNNHQRLLAAQLLAESRIPGTYGLTGVPDCVFGTSYQTAAIPEEVKRAYLSRIRSSGLDEPRAPRLRYLVAMQRHQCALAVAGYGEVTHRHAEALSLGVPLVSQDLSGIETGFPFRGGENVMYCQPDLIDLVATVRDAQTAEGVAIGAQGLADWRNWARDPLALLAASICDPIRAAM